MLAVRPRLKRVGRRLRDRTVQRLGSSSTRVARSLPAPGIRLFQAEWYLDTYGDVRTAGVDPVSHFLWTGASEGRRPNPLFFTDWYAEQYLGTTGGTDSFRHYLEVGQHEGLRFNPIADPAFIREEYGLRPDENPLLYLLTHPEADRVSAWFSRRAYRDFNPDVAAAGATPEVHYLDWGLREHRLCGSAFFVTSLPAQGPGAPSEQTPHEGTVEVFAWSGRAHRVTASLISHDVMMQVQAQAEIDPDVMAAGLHSIASLRQIVASDVDTQISADYRQLLDEVPMGQDAIIILAAVRLGGAEKYGANLAWGLKQVGLRDVLVITTEGTKASDMQGLALEGFAPMRDTPVASLGETLGRAAAPEKILTHVLLRSGARHVFVVNSWIALQAIASHGRALSRRMRIATTFFCEAPYAFMTPLSAVYLRDIVPYAVVLSDNRSTLEPFIRRVGPTASDRIHALYTTLTLSDTDTFQRTLAGRSRPRDGRVRALWLSRWERFQKAVDVLMRLAELEPACTIDAFGPNESTIADASIPANIRLMGRVPGPSSLPLEEYDVFLFTSYFEGMPNVVLEMAGAGIPIVASDVGGLRETFSADAIEFVPMNGSVDDMARAFQTALAKVTGESDEARTARLVAARQQVERQHGAEAFLTGIRAYLEGPA